MTASSGASADNAEGGEEDALPDTIDRTALGQWPRIWMVVIIALVSIVFAIVWLTIYYFLDTIIWNNDFVAANRWVLPAGVAAINGDYDAVLLGHDADADSYRVRLDTVDGPYCAVVPRAGGAVKCFKEGDGPSR